MTESEDWARRQLHHLGDVDLPVGGNATVDRVIARHRRQRRVRAAWLGTAAAIIAAVSIPVALAATRSAPANPSGGIAATGIAARTTSPAAPSTSGHARSSGDPGDPARSGPAQAVIGVAYPFDLYTHCGIRWARFVGREWTPVHPAPDPLRLPNSAGITTYSGYVAGTMTLIRPDLLRFTLTDPHAAGSGTSFDFVPARQVVPPCD
jgi:hypothetical protein